MPLQATSGAASYDAFGGGVPVVPAYIEEVFSTYLYTGAGTSATITNGIDLSTKGGLVWLKNRTNVFNNNLFDTARGVNQRLFSNTNSPSTSSADSLTAFNTDGFSIGTLNYGFNGSGQDIASWTFRKQPKFFDVVTYTGTGSAQNVAHSLGSVPGFIVYKRTSGAANWCVLARKSNGTYESFYLNTTGATQYTAADATEAGLTSTTFNPSAIFGGESNGTTGGGLYVAYLFAHDAGGFGLTGSDNVISCGSYTANGAANGPSVTLGYEPQWLMIKGASSGVPYNWTILDNMRGLDQTGSPRLFPNTSDAESAMSTGVVPTATGFKINTTNATVNDASGETYIYIAIRRGPMKVPTSGTSVYESTAYTGNFTAQRQIGSTVLLDAFLLSCRSADSLSWSSFAHYMADRLRGTDKTLSTSKTDAETGGWLTYFDFDKNVGWDTGSTTDQNYLNQSGSTFVCQTFKRAPSFFDVVCYTGTSNSVGRTVNHNLTVVPELMIVKDRSAANSWVVYVSPLGNTSGLILNGTQATITGRSDFWDSTTPTTSVFSVGSTLNANTVTWVAYLFATCASVSKVGSYTGTGTTKQIDCGFTAGARFVMIKRTDSTGDWYFWDTARGIGSSNDPYLLLNSSAAEVTSNDYIDTYSAGFEIDSTAPAAINASGGTYIFLAIA